MHGVGRVKSIYFEDSSDQLVLNSFVLNAPFLYPLKTSEKLTV